MIRAVLFDLGGTLHDVRTTPEWNRRYADMMLDRLKDYGIVIDDTPEGFLEELIRQATAYKRYSEKTMREEPSDQIWADFYLKKYGVTREQVRLCAEELSFRYDYDRPRVIRKPHLKETMQKLQEMGIRLGVISNIISESVVPHFLMEYGIYDCMDVILTSCGCGIRKPDPGIYRIAEERLELAPEELAYVGDTVSRDVIGTRNAGWRLMIQIPSGRAVDQILGVSTEDYQPDYVISDLLEIPDIIRKENAAD